MLRVALSIAAGPLLHVRGSDGRLSTSAGRRGLGLRADAGRMLFSWGAADQLRAAGGPQGIATNTSNSSDRIRRAIERARVLGP